MVTLSPNKIMPVVEEIKKTVLTQELSGEEIILALAITLKEIEFLTEGEPKLIGFFNEIYNKLERINSGN